MSETIDLLADAPRPFIRMSEGDGCGLRIGHAMLETVKPKSPDMALRMGSALEPAIVQFLADQGLECWFTGDAQLRLAYLDPMTVGHCDGLISGRDNLSSWAYRNLPQAAVDLFKDGDLLLLEIKTMNADSFNDFKRNGLTTKDALFRKYLVQINDYICTLNNPEYDEAWPDADEEYEYEDPATGEMVIGTRHIYGSDSFRTLLETQGFRRPEITLVVAFCPANKQYAFDLIPMRPEPFNRKKESLHNKVIVPMRTQGKLPDPAYDGHDPECFFCPVIHLCPNATSAVASTFALENIPLDAPPRIEHEEEVDELLARYFELGDTIKQLELEQKAVRLDLEALAEPGVKYVTGRNVFHFASVRGREMLDMETLSKIAAEYGFEIPKKRGAGHTRLYAKPLYGPSYDKKVEE